MNGKPLFLALLLFFWFFFFLFLMQVHFFFMAVGIKKGSFYSFKQQISEAVTYFFSAAIRQIFLEKFLRVVTKNDDNRGSVKLKLMSWFDFFCANSPTDWEMNKIGWFSYKLFDFIKCQCDSMQMRLKCSFLDKSYK